MLYNTNAVPQQPNYTDHLAFRINATENKWAVKLYEQMRANFWIPQKINLTQDINDYSKLTSDEKFAFKRILAFLVFLDNVQTTNLTYLVAPIETPDIKCCIAEQTSQEYLHSQSYQYLIDTVLPSEDRDEIYTLVQTDNKLKLRSRFIFTLFAEYIEKPSYYTFVLSLIADYILEGLYFYSAFNFFYNLSSRNLMKGCADMIKLIHRDELTHVTLFKQLILLVTKDQDPSYLDFNFKDYFFQAVETEINWTNYVSNNITGLNNEDNKKSIQYITHQLMRNLSLTSPFTSAVNPYLHLTKIADIQGASSTKVNFFEGNVTSYTQSSSIKNWDF
jgi:ribonucleoside-diphosphate reductase beta chain